MRREPPKAAGGAEVQNASRTSPPFPPRDASLGPQSVVHRRLSLRDGDRRRRSSRPCRTLPALQDSRGFGVGSPRGSSAHGGTERLELLEQSPPAGLEPSCPHLRSHVGAHRQQITVHSESIFTHMQFIRRRYY